MSSQAGPSTHRYPGGESPSHVLPLTTTVDAPARRRRVPDNLRQRIEISCDRCKKRKRKCIRQSEEDTCAACDEAGAECRSTLPRKRRLAPTQPALRYDTLDAIVRKLCPDADIDSTAGVLALAERLGVDPPKSANGDHRPGDSDPPYSSHDHQHIEPQEIPEGWLVPAPRGGHHYVGPASLVYFARCARQLVAKSNTLKNPTYDEVGLRRYRQAAEFTTYKVSHTIEAGLQDHPATFAAGTELSPSAASILDPSGDIRSRPSPGGSDAFRHARLPDRATADTLINAFFERVHPNLPILHRGALQVIYESANSRSIDPALEPGKACTLYMVFTFGAQALEGSLPAAQAIQQQYLSIVIREGLGRLVLTSTLSNVQALLLLALYQHNAGERNTAYILVGQAIRAAVASGLHKDGENGDFDRREFDPFERNTRRTVWWCTHILEQTISLALGRPSFTDVIHVNTSLPDTPFEQGIGLPANYLENYVSLSNFMVKIKRAVGMVSVHYQSLDRLVEYYPTVLTLHTELITWKKGLPPSLSLGQTFASPIHRRLILLLLVWSDYLESVLCRPFLLGRVNQDLEGNERPHEVDEIAEFAVSAAHASVTKLLILADYGLLESSVWLDFYAAQHAIMVTSLQFLGQPEAEEWESSREPIARLITVAQSMRTAPTFRITMNVALQLSCIAGIGPDLSVALDAPTAGTPDKATDLPIMYAPQQQIIDTTAQLFGPLPPAMPQSTEPAIFSDLYNLGYNAESANPWDFFNIGDFAGDFFSSMPQGMPHVSDSNPASM